jgi:Tfp pilus assembly protein PilN
MPLDTHRINLLPVAIRAKREGRQFVFLLVLLAAGIVAFQAFLWFQKNQQVNNAKAKTEAERATNRQLQTEITKLGGVEVKAKAVSDKEALVKASWKGDVSWYRVLQDIATTMPSQTWLTNFQSQSSHGGTTGGASATPASAPQNGPITLAGSFTVSGKGFDHPDSADWISRISQMREVANLWLSNSAASGGTSGTQRTITFSSTGMLTNDALSPRGKHAEDGNLYEGTNAQ